MPSIARLSSRLLQTAIAIASTVAIAHLAAAQTPAATDSTPAHFARGSAQTIGGYAGFDFKELNSRFAAAGLPTISSGAATIGLGADIRIGRGLVGGAFQSILSRDNHDAAHRTRMSGSYTLLDVGYAVVSSGSTSIYPVIGIGATSLSVNVRERGDFAFNDGLDSPHRELSLSEISAVIHLGVVAEHRFQRGSGSEFAISLRYGITNGLGSQSWRSEESKVSGGPGGMRGSYLRLAFAKPLQHRRDGILPIAAAALQTVLR